MMYRGTNKFSPLLCAERHCYLTNVESAALCRSVVKC